MLNNNILFENHDDEFIITVIFTMLSLVINSKLFLDSSKSPVSLTTVLTHYYCYT